MKLDDVDTGRVEGTTSDERVQLVRLRRELRVAKMEIEILRRASAYFDRAVLPNPKWGFGWFVSSPPTGSPFR